SEGGPVCPFKTACALKSKAGSSKNVCSRRINTGTAYQSRVDAGYFTVPKNKLAAIMIVNAHSILFKAPKTNLPIPRPKGTVMPGAWNFSQDSIKLMAAKQPAQTKTVAMMINELIFIKYF